MSYTFRAAADARGAVILWKTCRDCFKVSRPVVPVLAALALSVMLATFSYAAESQAEPNTRYSPDTAALNWVVLAVVILAGAAGGFVSGMITQPSYKLRAPISGRLVELGFVGDLMVGAAAATSILVVATPLFGIDPSDALGIQDFFRLLSLCVLAGFAGIRLLAGMSKTVLNKLTAIEEGVERREKVGEYVTQGDFFIQQNKLDQALSSFSRALALDSKHESALIGEAKVYKRKNKLDRAIGIVSEIIKHNPNSDRSFYNLACYRCLAGQELAEVLADLQTSIELFPEHRVYARDDEDFASIRHEAEFRRLVEGG